MGKLSNENLKKLLSCIKKDTKVIVPPLPGFDSGVHLIDNKYLVISTDPCIGVPKKWFGWLLIHYAASDVALFGAKPEFSTINLLGPPSTKPQVFIKIMEQTCKAADELKVTIITGHTGSYEGLSTLVGVCTVYGTVDKESLITPAGANPGDFILCTKPIGLETVVNFTLMNNGAAEKLFGSQKMQKLAELVNMQSCVKEALMLAKIGGIHAMHDATEGGLIAALNEIAEASKVGFKIEFEKVPVQNEVYFLQKHFKFSDEQLMAMSSTGTILAAVSPEAKDNIKEYFHQSGAEARFLGFFTKSNRRLLIKNGQETLFPRKANDPYERIISEKL